MKRFTNFKKSVAVLLSLVIALSSFSILSVFAAETNKEKSEAHLGFITADGATMDEAVSGLTYITLKTSTAYGINWKAGDGIHYVKFKNQVTGQTDRFWTDDTMGFDKAFYSNGTSKLAFCIHPHTRYLSGYQSLTDADSTANKSYWKKFKNNTKLYNSIAEVIAFARPRIKGDMDEKHSNYIATQLIIWEYICGYRSTSTHELTTNGINLTKFINGPNERITKIKTNYKEILKSIDDADEVEPQLCASLNKAKAAHDPFNPLTNFVLNNATHSRTRKISGYDPDVWENPKIVNQNNNAPSSSWGFKLTQNGKKFTVTANKSIADDDTSSRFYIRFKKKLNYSKVSTDVAYNTSSPVTGSEASQTLVSELSYSKNVYAYFPLAERPIPQSGKLVVKKKAESSDGTTYTKSLKGWTFAVKNLTTNKTEYLTTDKSGESDELTDIALPTTFEVTEIGKKLPNGYNPDDYTNIKTYGGVKYGFPRGWSSSTTSPKTVKVTKSEDVETKTVSWKNVYDKPYKIEIEKVVTDGASTAGYYFAVADSKIAAAHASDEVLLNDVKILGPTNEAGITSIYLDNVSSKNAANVLLIRELGLLKAGQTFSNSERTITYQNLEECTGPCAKFKIPDRYTTGYENNNNIARWAPLGGKVAFANNNKFVFHYDYGNKTNGYFKVFKTDATNGKKLNGAVYGIYFGKAADADNSGDEPEDPNASPTIDNNDPSDETDPPVIDDDDDDPAPVDDDNDDTGFDEHITGGEIPRYTITIENGEALSPYLPTGSYYIKELVPPKGYKLDETRYDVILDVGHNTKEKALRVDVTDQPTDIRINKTIASTLDNNGKPLAGAKLEIYTVPNPAAENPEDRVEKLVYSFTSGNTTEKITGKLEYGKTYRLHEKSAPKGYCLADDITFTVTNDTTTLNMQDESTIIKVAKIDSETNKYIPNATLQIVKNGTPVPVTINGATVTSFKSKTTPITIEGSLVAGESYALRELDAPPGYIKKASDVPFQVNNKGKVITISISNAPVTTEFVKTDFVTGEEVPGCTLQVIDKVTNTVVDSWTSTNEVHKIKRLVIGKTYIMRETYPCDGYAYSEDVEFTVTGSTTPVQKVEMKDKPTSIKVGKTDSETNNLVAGATLQILRNGTPVSVPVDGKMVTSFKSKTTLIEFTGVFKAGETLYLHETAAPPGYVRTAEDVKFVVDEKGVEKTVKIANQPTEIEFYKTDFTTGAEVPGCELCVIDKITKAVVDSWTSGNTPHKIKRLVVGKTYIMRETSPVDGYSYSEDIEFTVTGATNPIQKVEMKDKPTVVKIGKTDSKTNKLIKGATLQILKNGTPVSVPINGKNVTSFMSQTTPISFIGVFKAGENLTLHEVKAPDGYIKTAKDVPFVVSTSGVPITVNIANEPTEVEFYKTDFATGAEVPGCGLQVVDKATNTVVDSWTSGNNPHKIERLVIGKVYIMKETSTVDYYTTSESIEFTVTGEKNPNQKVEMKNKPTNIEINKVDITDEKEIKNCKLKVIDKETGAEIDSWVSGKTTHSIVGKTIVGRTYTLIETYPANGYKTANSVDFTVVDNHKVSQKVTMKDEPTEVEFSKTKVADSAELPGCGLKVTDSTGTVIEEWVSTNTPHTIKGKLIVGKKYTLTETYPAEFYMSAQSIEFTVADKAGEVQKVHMEDKPTEVIISKTSIVTGQELPGCKLEIRNKDNQLIEAWTSTSEPHTIKGKLIVGQKYTLIETKPVDGYTTAESVEFTVKDSTELENGKTQKVVMENNIPTVEFSKKSITGDAELPGCRLKVVDKETNTEIDSWTSTSTAHVISGILTVGKTYTLIETYPVDGYTTANSVDFVVKDTNRVQKVEMKNKPTSVKISKQDITNDEELPNCKLKVVDKNTNKEIDSWTSTNEPHLIEGKLAVGKTYILIETYPADGYTTANNVEFTVEDNNKVTQVVEMKNTPTHVEFVKLAGDTNAQLAGCVISVVDSNNQEVLRFTTTDKAYDAIGVLKAGATYTMKEISAKKGYMPAEPVTFTVEDSHQKQTVTMVDLKYPAPDIPETGSPASALWTLATILSLLGAGIFFAIRKIKVK